MPSASTPTARRRSALSSGTARKYEMPSSKLESPIASLILASTPMSTFTMPPSSSHFSRSRSCLGWRRRKENRRRQRVVEASDRQQNVEKRPSSSDYISAPSFSVGQTPWMPAGRVAQVRDRYLVEMWRRRMATFCSVVNRRRERFVFDVGGLRAVYIQRRLARHVPTERGHSRPRWLGKLCGTSTGCRVAAFRQSGRRSRRTERRQNGSARNRTRQLPMASRYAGTSRSRAALVKR